MTLNNMSLLSYLQTQCFHDRDIWHFTVSTEPITNKGLGNFYLHINNSFGQSTQVEKCRLKFNPENTDMYSISI